MGGSGRQWPRSSRINVNKPLVVRLTRDIIHTYQICNPTFTYSESFNPKRYLTNPSTGFLNDGLDNANSDYILTVNTLLVNSDGDRRYIVKDLLGQGTFGQVVKCWSCQTNNFVAVKVIKNQPAYYQQAMVEISILTMLNQNFDPEDEHHIVRIRDHFVFHGHLCIVFEMLGANLYELVKTNQFRGISLNLLKIFAKQILDSLLVLRDASVIHCDLKPENILLTTSMHSAEIKVIDFGSACMENQRIYSYIQSRFYRSPEVVLGHPYTTTIDMWSFGCIAAELFLGLPLFPGASEYDLMKRMIERLGGQPPDQILRTARNASKYFKYVGNFWVDESQEVKGEQSVYRFLSESEYEAREKKKPPSGKRYFNYVSLEDIIINYPHRKKMTEEELVKENQTRISFIDFLRGLVQFDPVKRWTPRQAAHHPFLTEEPFRGPYRPFPDAPRVPVFNGIMVNDKPDSIHGFYTCHLTQVVDTKENTYCYSPQYQPTQCNHTNSYNRLGSFGIHGESCWYQVDSHIGDFPRATSLICQVNCAPADSCLGQSPGRFHRTMPIAHGHAQGVSPLNGIFRPMSSGFSPQHLYSSHLVQLSPASPGKQGPNSIARDCVHATALGREAGVGHYNKTLGVGMLGSLYLNCQQNIMPHCQVKHPNHVCADIDIDSGSNTYCNPCDCYHVSHWDHESSILQPLVQEFGTITNPTLVAAYDKISQIPNFHFSKGTLFTTQGMCSTGGEKIFSALPGGMIPN